ncbi:MAG: hypothetical protein E6F94_02020 [Actinobacteria bacterium]|nr:MAG: hypothetical protein E6G38_02565 [Actinomycetota bacterium]TMM27374.1 MAG: hypothetical protein E6F94_02020 [Actinomycetota bacterium]
MEVAGVLQMLDETGAEADVRPALALLAAPDPLVEPDELKPAVRRAMLLLAAGGDPLRELELDGRAVSSLAAELDRPERRAVVSRGLEALSPEAAGLANVSGALEQLLLDATLAWRAYACALLADELEP